jgi:hypothetical protein
MTEILTRTKQSNRITLRSCQGEELQLFDGGLNTPAPVAHQSARIFRHGRPVTTSARVTYRPWRLVFERRTPPVIDHLMGYCGGSDTLTQVQLDFPTREAAVAFAEKQQLDYVVQADPPVRPRPNVRKLFRERLPVRQTHTKEPRHGSRNHREVTMTSLAFFTPVQVKTNDVIHDINSVREALMFLNQWPKPRRGPVYSCAVRSCNAAIAGQMTTDQARQAFVGFARIAGVLAKSDSSASTDAKVAERPPKGRGFS